MRLLLITQKVDRNDSVLGFMHRWITEFARQCQSVLVICLYEGEHDLPENVRVISLGKEEGASRFEYIRRFYKAVISERKNYDSVFVHMNQIYVNMAGLLWRLFGKKVGLWYAHGGVPASLYPATWLSHNIFTSTESGYRISSRKKRVVGQGIDTNDFPKRTGEPQFPLSLISVGRISPVKDYGTLVEAVSLLKDKVTVTIVGGAGLPSQEKYLEELKEKIFKTGLSDQFTFTGPVANEKIIEYLNKSHIFVNMSHTGSLDKAILEAMSIGLPVLTCNEALLEVLGSHTDMLMYEKSNPEALVRKIEMLAEMTPAARTEIGHSLRAIVEDSHSIGKLVKSILSYYDA